MQYEHDGLNLYQKDSFHLDDLDHGAQTSDMISRHGDVFQGPKTDRGHLNSNQHNPDLIQQESRTSTRNASVQSQRR